MPTRQGWRVFLAGKIRKCQPISKNVPVPPPDSLYKTHAITFSSCTLNSLEKQKKAEDTFTMRFALAVFVSVVTVIVVHATEELVRRRDLLDDGEFSAIAWRPGADQADGTFVRGDEWGREFVHPFRDKSSKSPKSPKSGTLVAHFSWNDCLYPSHSFDGYNVNFTVKSWNFTSNPFRFFLFSN